MATNDTHLIEYHAALLKERATHPMNPEVKKILVEALRSGQYPQTVGYLQVVESSDSTRPVGFCCLGVLSEEAKKRGVPNVDSVTISHLDTHAVEYFQTGDIGNKADFSANFLIEAVATWAAFPPLVDSSLMGLNDSGATFDQIADLVEEYL